MPAGRRVVRPEPLDDQLVRPNRIQWLRQAMTSTSAASAAMPTTTIQKLAGSSFPRGPTTFIPSSPAISDPRKRY